MAESADPRDKAKEAILELITGTADKATGLGGNTSSQSGISLELAEAYAWTVNPAQDHG